MPTPNRKVLSAKALSQRISLLEKELKHLRTLQARAAEEDGKPQPGPATCHSVEFLAVVHGESLREIEARTGISKERVRQKVAITLKRHFPELFEKFKGSSLNLCAFLQRNRDIIDVEMRSRGLS